MLKHAREINSRRFIHDFAWLSIEKIVLEKLWEKITDTCAFFMVVWCPTHYQTLSTRKNWLLCVQNTLLAFCHTGPTKRMKKNRVELKKRVELKFILVYTQGRMLRKLQVKKTDSQLRIPIQNFQIASDRRVLPYWKFWEKKENLIYSLISLFQNNWNPANMLF